MASIYEIFESSPCHRCGGGKVFRCWSHVWGGRCFGCGGAGYKLTRHGKADYDRWRAAVDAATLRPVTEVQPGQFVKLDAAYDFRKYYRVEAVGTEGGKATLTFDRIITTYLQVGDMTLPTAQKSWEVQLDQKVRIHPGQELFPKAEAFVTPRRSRRSRKAPEAAPAPENPVAALPGPARTDLVALAAQISSREAVAA